MIFRKADSEFFGDDHVQGHRPEWIMPYQRPAAIRPLGRARCPWLPRGWTPSERQRPWQDRRMLISHCDQRPAILRMVFVFLGSALSW